MPTLPRNKIIFQFPKYPLKEKNNKRLNLEPKYGNNPDSNDKSLQSLIFIIKALEEHEHYLDKSIDNLTTCLEQIGDAEIINEKIMKIEEKIDRLLKDITACSATYQKNHR